ncbi:MAG: rod shape-determining protein MreD [Candidatus Aminicenantes bacterium RBG_13_63_10]|nr:MAG: rod shape-determining protein MreD [Candidatus Aminicenantes bacterium RBG_13_63_10]
MRDFLRGAGGLAAALVLHMILSRTAADFTPLLHVFLLAVLFGAMARGELFGAVMGSCCGLAADSLSLGVFGISGFSMTVVGYLAGATARRINVLPFFRNAVFLFVMTGLEFVLWSLWAGLTVGRLLDRMRGLILLRPMVTALAGAAVFAAFRYYRRRHGR